MPIYVAHDSMDVWQNPSQFLFDEKYNPTVAAGVPPDAFSADGQLWGNPIYSWKTMQNDRYGWWKNRVGQCFKLYDILRIDHFRGFSSPANLAVIPLQDYMELVNEQGRINTPSKAEGNWDYRLSPAYNKGKLAEKIKDITKATKRAK